MSNNFYKLVATEFAKQFYNGTKIVAVCLTALVACLAFWRYFVGLDADTAFMAGMISYIVLGCVYAMIDVALTRARMKEKYPDIDFS